MILPGTYILRRVLIALPSLPPQLFGVTVPRFDGPALADSVNTALTRGLIVAGCVLIVGWELQ